MESRTRAVGAVVVAARSAALLIGVVAGDVMLRGRGRGDLSPLADGGVVLAVAAFASAVMGTLVLLRTRHVVGWLLLGVGGSIALSGFAEAYAAYGELASPGALPLSAWIAPLSEAAFWWVFGFLALTLVLTPSGAVPDGAWRRLWPVPIAGASVWMVATLLSDASLDPPLESLANPMALDGLQPVLGPLEGIAALATHGALVAGCVSIVRRFRRATGVERQQLRWVAFGGGIAAAAAVAAFASALAGQDLLLVLASAVLVSAIPIGVGVSVTRYRLYELDRIVSRSLVLAGLTIGVSLVYLGVVSVLSAVAGESRSTAGIAAVAAALAVAPLRSRLQRRIDRLLFGRRAEPFSVVSDLSARLQSASSPDVALQALVDTVTAELRLPSIAVLSPTAEPLVAAGHDKSVTAERFPLTYQGEDLGELVVGLRRGEDAFEAPDRQLLLEVARQAGSLMQASLTLRDLQAARLRLVSAREEERRRLRNDLHDGLGPQLSAVTFKVDAARNHLRTDVESADRLLDEVRSDVTAAIDDIRRLVYALRPPGLDDLGLLGAVQRHAESCASPGSGVRIEVRGERFGSLPAPVEVAAYRIAVEAITNTLRHANARRCEVDIRMDEGVVVEVVDDGAGLGDRWRAGVGVSSMRQRAQELGGSCTVETARHGGTRVLARLPAHTRSSTVDRRADPRRHRRRPPHRAGRPPRAVPVPLRGRGGRRGEHRGGDPGGRR